MGYSEWSILKALRLPVPSKTAEPNQQSWLASSRDYRHRELLYRAGGKAKKADASIIASPTPAPSSQKKVLIVSEPPGARIEINEDYVGDTPIEVKIDVSSDGNFARGATIKATPVGQGYLQTKYFDPGMAVPSRLLFDTRLGPATTQ